MGNVCQDQPVQTLQVINAVDVNANRKPSENPREPSEQQLPRLEGLQSKVQQIGSSKTSKPKEAEPVSLPELNEKVKNAVDKQYDQNPLSGPPLSFQNPPQYIKEQQAYYQGDWRDGQPHGKGSIYFNSGAYFQGQLIDGQVDCKDGILVLPDGSFYRGQFKKSLFDGKGKFSSALGTTYSGNWEEGVPHGKGEEHFPDGNSYQGNFSNGVKSGQGIFKWSDGRVYEGQFRSGMMNGFGKFYKGDKEFFQGEFQNNKKIGRTKLRTQYGTYSAQFEDGEIVGEGTFEWNDQTMYEGNFKNGLPHGGGTLKLPQGKTLVGIWEEGKNKKIKDVKSGGHSRSRSRSRSRHSARDE